MTTPRTIAGIMLLALLLFAVRAEATTFRRPFDPTISLGYGFDNKAGAGCEDYACGSKCYDGHKGSDFPLTLSTVVRAGADGTVEFTNDGCASVGFFGSTCGGGYGNYVKILHADGKQTYYAHMKNGSLAVSQGQQVNCGDKLGESASSGNSTGYHLHFEVRVGGSGDDPFSGQCGGPLSYWVDQGAYDGAPSTQCETLCECEPGDTQTESCGNCGVAERSCGNDCQWSDFGSCSDEGECSPNEEQSQACGECGEQSRSCLNDCSWNDYSACEGPDPNDGKDVCDTSLPGICAQGRVRCVEGDIQCLPVEEDERCGDPGEGGNGGSNFGITTSGSGSNQSATGGAGQHADNGNANRGLEGFVCSAPTAPPPQRRAWWFALALAAIARRRPHQVQARRITI